MRACARSARCFVNHNNEQKGKPSWARQDGVTVMRFFYFLFFLGVRSCNELSNGISCLAVASWVMSLGVSVSVVERKSIINTTRTYLCFILLYSPKEHKACRSFLLRDWHRANHEAGSGIIISLPPPSPSPFLKLSTCLNTTAAHITPWRQKNTDSLGCGDTT